MPPFEIIVVPALSDNYIYIAHDSSNKTTLVVDPQRPSPLLMFSTRVAGQLPTF